MKYRVAVLVVVLLGSAACVRLRIPAPEVHDYRLDYPPPAVTGTPLAAVLRVLPLGVAAIYDREPIVYREDAYSTGTYFTSRWSANPGSMVADLLARDFAYSQLYRAVQQGPSTVPADYQLGGDIDEIEERSVAGGCAAHLAVRCTLVPLRGATNPIALQTTYAEDEACACNDPRALAAAMSGALARVSARLQRDVYDAIAAATPR